MSAQTLLSGGDKWYSYSGSVFGDVSVPATIQMVFIPNTGLRDSYVVIEPFLGKEASTSGGNQLGIEVKLDDVTIIKQQQADDPAAFRINQFQIFVPRQSKLEVISLNNSANNTQERGCNLLGYYL